MNKKTISLGFIFAGLMNILGVTILSRLFTNATIHEFDPVVMSKFGLLMIVVWGLAYISVAKEFEQLKWLVGTFVLEKFIYGYIWIKWQFSNELSDVFAKDWMAGLFYSIYGINDWMCFIFFSFVFVKILKSQSR